MKKRSVDSMNTSSADIKLETKYVGFVQGNFNVDIDRDEMR